MSLNIKSPEAHELAAELARLTGQSLTRAVIEAIRERLERKQRQRDRDKIVAEALTIARRVAKVSAPRSAPARRVPLRRAWPAPLMIVDTSALLAVFFEEPEAEDFAQAIAGAEVPRMSAANLLEAGIVADNQTDPRTGRQLDALVANFRLRIEPVTEEQVLIARQAYLDFGRGNRPRRAQFRRLLRLCAAQGRRRAAAVQGRRLRTD